MDAFGVVGLDDRCRGAERWMDRRYFFQCRLLSGKIFLIVVLEGFFFSRSLLVQRTTYLPARPPAMDVTRFVAQLHISGGRCPRLGAAYVQHSTARSASEGVVRVYKRHSYNVPCLPRLRYAMLHVGRSVCIVPREWTRLSFGSGTGSLGREVRRYIVSLPREEWALGMGMLIWARGVGWCPHGLAARRGWDFGGEGGMFLAVGREEGGYAAVGSAKRCTHDVVVFLVECFGLEDGTGQRAALPRDRSEDAS